MSPTSGPGVTAVALGRRRGIARADGRILRVTGDSDGGQTSAMLGPHRISLVLALSLAGCMVGDEASDLDAAIHGAADTDTAAGAAESSGDGSDTDPAADAGSTTDEPATQSGEELYAGLCASCHGAQGEGTQLGYELAHPSRQYAIWVVRNGRQDGEFPTSVMAAYPPEVVSDEQLEEILDWLDGLEQPQVGETLYLDYCGNCHGADPNDGGIVGKKVGGKSFSDTVDKVRKGKGGDAYGDREAYMPGFDEARLDDVEIQAITDWFATL